MTDTTPQPSGQYTQDNHPFASRGGLKLDKALAESGIDVARMTCADLGSSTGGFVSCLLLRGAARVYAVDTGYGILDYKLRTDDRVVVMERSNALHTDPPPEAPQAEPASAGGSGGLVGSGGSAGGSDNTRTAVDLVTIDLGWTKQDKALAAANRWLSPTGRVITLVKPHYERPRDTPERRGKGKGKSPPKPEPLDESQARAIADDVLARIDADAALGLRVLGSCVSPIRGAKGGNLEVLAWLERR